MLHRDLRRAFLAVVRALADRGDKAVKLDADEEAIVKEQFMRLGKLIKDCLPEGWAFALFMADVGDDGHTYFLSDIERPAVVMMLEEWIARHKKEIEERSKGVH